MYLVGCVGWRRVFFFVHRTVVFVCVFFLFVVLDGTAPYAAAGQIHFLYFVGRPLPNRLQLFFVFLFCCVLLACSCCTGNQW
jgi:hypothetical protein